MENGKQGTQHLPVAVPPLPISSPVLGVEWGYLLDSFLNIFIKLRKTFRLAALDEFPLFGTEK